MIMYQKNIFSIWKASVILEGGPVSAMGWTDRFAAFNWGTEVRIYDVVECVTISRVRFSWDKYQNSLFNNSRLISSNSNSKKELMSHLHGTHRCNLFWKDLYTIFIGWADIIKVCQVMKYQFSCQHSFCFVFN